MAAFLIGQPDNGRCHSMPVGIVCTLLGDDSRFTASAIVAAALAW